MRRIKWPGEAAVVIATVHIHKGHLDGPYLLDERPVERISAFLFHAGADANPARLAANAGKSFVGSYVLGMGFTFDDQNLAKGSTPIAEMHPLIEQNPRNAERIFPYIGGEEVNSRPTHAHHRYVINFEDMSEDDARRWPDLMRIVEDKVRPIRETDNRRAYRDYWWRFAERRSGLGPAIAPLNRVLVRALTSSHFSAFTFLPNGLVYDQTLLVFAFDDLAPWGCLVSRVHEVWALFFGATMKDDPRYNLADCFQTFPFPPGFERDPTLEAAGEAYYGFRVGLMVARDEGLTRTYNDFHDRRLRADPEIQRLRELHDAMDRAVLRAYGWDDLAEAAAPVFLDEDNEDEFAYQGRLFWPSDFRDEVLARLLALNAERHADEVRRGVAPASGRSAAVDQEELVDG
jgi:hypothetical protein